jgi:outer membrane protein assembly factor BamB
MRIKHGISAFLCLAGTLLYGQGAPENADGNWQHWRGPGESGVVSAGNPPLEWSETENIRWKAAIPGKGHATPIIWGDQLILLAAVPTDKRSPAAQDNGEGEGQDWMNPTSTDLIHRFEVISVDKHSGAVNWETTLREELPHSQTHQFGSWASNSPVTDGRHIYAYFGSHGLYCLDMEGRIIWERNLGRMEKRMSFGEGSSPVLYGDWLIVQRDHQGPSALHVLDKLTGETVWESERDEISSWSTPLVIEYRGRAQLVTSATNRVRSYDVRTGKLLWECGGMTGNVIPSPVFAGGLVYLMSGFRGSALLAIDLSKATGDITGTEAVAWSYDQNTPYTPSPVLMDGKLYFLKGNNGYLSCLNAADGAVYYANVRLEGIGNIFSSPVGIGDRLYILGMNGTTCVVSRGETFGVLSRNTLEDKFIASPVVSGDCLYLRGEQNLYCICGE